MGYRTVVILYNDEASTWENDPNLGKKIGEAGALNRCGRDGCFNGGKVVEVSHADIQTLAVIDGYSFRELSSAYWVRDQTMDAVDLELLKRAADNLGYRLVKKANK